MEIVILLFAVALFAYMAYFRKIKKGWHVLWSEGVPKRPKVEGAGWSLDFPQWPGHVNYVQWFQPPKLKGQVSTSFTVEGSGFVADGYPGEPAVVSLIIQRKGDKGKDMAYRWYSRLPVTLRDGSFRLDVPLIVEHWYDVMGGQDADAFAAALEHAESIGLVFGAPGGRGHGVYGGGRFVLHKMTVA